MKKLIKLIITLVVSGIMFFTGISANAAAILFGRVASSSYVADGQQLVDYLVAGGNTVDYVDLNSTIISDFSLYSQVWVYDLVTGANQSATQQANYSNIANWYNGLADQNLIADGRIISSSASWTNRTNGLGLNGEVEWIQNYANLLDSQGGGLMLGTDHDAYHSGINSINQQIGIDPFTGNYYTDPYEAYIDPASPLFVTGLETCSFDSTQNCINDNSSTGFAPTGLQANGQTLTPVAYHGSVSEAYTLAAVSTTFGSTTFNTCGGPNQPPCINNTVPEPSILALISLGLVGIGFTRRRRNKQS
jgi:hypothetical protein